MGLHNAGTISTRCMRVNRTVETISLVVSAKVAVVHPCETSTVM